MTDAAAVRFAIARVRHPRVARQGLFDRDTYVLRQCLARRIPVVTVVRTHVPCCTHARPLLHV